MKTLTVDNKKRVRLVHSKPGQVFSVHANADGSVLLVPVKEIKRKAEAFPRGSLLKYLTPERDKEQLAILKGCNS